MKQFFKNNRPLWISFLITAAAAIVTVTAIACAVVPSTGALAVRTVAAAQTLQENGTDPIEDNVEDGVPTPTPVPAEQPVQAGDQAVADQNVKAWRVADIRRSRMDRGVIPHGNGEWHQPYLEWVSNVLKEGEEHDKAVAAANDWFQKLCGLSMKPETTVTIWHDPKGYRADYIQVADADQETIVSMDRKTLALINLDTARTDGKQLLANDTAKKTIGEVLAALSYTAQKTAKEEYESEWAVYTKEGPVVVIEPVSNAIASVRVHENVACYEELVYFVADLQMHAEYVEKVNGEAKYHESNETQQLARNPESITFAQLQNLVSLFYQQATGASGGAATTLQPEEATLFLEQTNSRESYWLVKKECTYGNIEMKVSADNGYILSFAASGLSQADGTNPTAKVMKEGDDWDDMTYTDQIEQEYIQYVQDHFVPWFNVLARGQERGQVKDVTVNAIYDFYYVTVDIELNDGTTYELHFSHGMLDEIQYFFSADSMWLDIPSGTMKEDALYRNKVTGEEFYSAGLYW